MAKYRMIAIILLGIIAVFAAKPLMTYIMYLQENQKSQVIVEPPDEVVGFDAASGGMAGFGSPGPSAGGEAKEEAEASTDTGSTEGSTEEPTEAPAAGEADESA